MTHRTPRIKKLYFEVLNEEQQGKVSTAPEIGAKYERQCDGRHPTSSGWRHTIIGRPSGHHWCSP